jgi:nucleotide-binding universal stress UspA family protein
MRRVVAGGGPWKAILIATDGSATAASAIEVGLEIASEQGADVVLLHVRAPGHADPSPDLESAMSRAAGLAVSWLLELAEGDAAVEIVARARALDADLVVVGSRGRSSASASLGSVSKEVLRLSDRPVLIVGSGTR